MGNAPGNAPTERGAAECPEEPLEVVLNVRPTVLPTIKGQKPQCEPDPPGADPVQKIVEPVREPGNVAPDLMEACRHLGSVLELLSEISMKSTVELIPEGEDWDPTLQEHAKHLSAISTQCRLNAEQMNPKWNKTFGEGGTTWAGSCNERDGRPRGGMPYYCPNGWVRFSLKICNDSDFESRFKDWGYLYHGTKGKYVGSILTSGFRAHGGCYCGDGQAFYMSPSIEYCAHPRYSGAEYNPETNRWVQMVLQCRVRPETRWKVEAETLGATGRNVRVDPNFSNEELEWLFKPNHQEGPHHYVRDAIVCTGIMVRITEKHPLDLDHWWTKHQYLVKHHFPVNERVMPLRTIPSALSECFAAGWKQVTAKQTRYQLHWDGVYTGKVSLQNEVETNMGISALSPAPFASGAMRLAWVLRTSAGLFTVKRYNEETMPYIREVWGINEKRAILNDVQTYLMAEQFAQGWNQQARLKECQISFVEPMMFDLDGVKYFGEPYMPGRFVKWNNNAGDINRSAEALADYAADYAALFCHYTFHASDGHLMVVDLQGWDTGTVTGIKFTDPQIHSSLQRRRKADMRFSIGNLGRTGMAKFFVTHDCAEIGCKKFGFSRPRARASGSAGA